MTGHIHAFIDLDPIRMDDAVTVEISFCLCRSFRARVLGEEKIWDGPNALTDEMADAIGTIIGDWSAGVVRRRKVLS